MPLVPLDILPQPPEWQSQCGSWRDGVFTIDPGLITPAPLLRSPKFALQRGGLVLLTFSGRFDGEADYVLHVVTGWRRRRVHSSLFEMVAGEARLSLAFRPRKSGSYRLLLELQDPRQNKPTITAPTVLVQGVGGAVSIKGRLAELAEVPRDSSDAGYLQHWNLFQRFIHRRCRESRWFNNIVAAVEMRLGREEVLSLPQYMGLCPTGQCNALCDFCSVTVNRTGIIKKQLPFQRLEAFLAPVSNAIQMYGMEGNGEPTLYTHFPELVERLTRGGAAAYLITNGSRLQLKDVPLLLTLDSVNFSLNAATAATHRRVMKLKGFDEIVTIIRTLARYRGRKSYETLPMPAVYASFVVTNDNINETQEFLRFAEQDLGIDVALVRPLSELANENGVVEDVRHLVPFESDVKDMIDAVREYIQDLPQRRNEVTSQRRWIIEPALKYMPHVPGTTEIRIAPETFRSYRPDPVGRVVMPRGFEGRLLAPRRGDWSASHPGVVAAWHLNSAHITLPAVEGELLRSRPVPVEPERDLIFAARIAISGGPVSLSVENDDRVVVAEAVLADTHGRTLPIELQIKTGSTFALSFALTGRGSPAEVEIDFERLRTPAPYVGREFSIPSERRWELCAPDAAVEWAGNELRLRSATGGRPYLLKSYSVPCARDATIELPLELEVSEGSIEIGILDERNRYLQTFHFAPGRTNSGVFFSTGESDNVQLVLSAAPDQPVEATVRWLKPHLIEHAEECENLSISPPDVAEWEACVPRLDLKQGMQEISLAWRGVGSPYLLKSNKIRCGANRAATARIAVDVEAGPLCVGVLDGSGARWLGTHVLDEGDHRVELSFNSQASDGVFLVFAAVDGAPVAASIALGKNKRLNGDADWRRVELVPDPVSAVEAAGLGNESPETTALDAQAEIVPGMVPSQFADQAVESAGPAANGSMPEQDETEVGFTVLESGETAPFGGAEQNGVEAAFTPTPSEPVVGNVPKAAHNGVISPAGKPAPKVLVRSTKPRSRSKRGTIRYYCQKPWTDLHNFTVDGRMDVCCIATGASQERYQLGNLARQTFQEIWNGPMMQEFRRTVNNEDKLPPCARCPMSYAYQGLWFDPHHTRMRVLAAFRKMKLGWLGDFCAKLIERMVFARFNRKTRWMS